MTAAVQSMCCCATFYRKEDESSSAKHVTHECTKGQQHSPSCAWLQGMRPTSTRLASGQLP
eukprot:1159870-Pelagomonas_calceolata.AAC.18